MEKILDKTRKKIRRKRILIIDDDLVICEVLQRFFTGIGFRAAIAGSAEEGLEIIDDLLFLEEPLDFLVVDYNLPGMNGLEAVDRLQEMGLILNIIVISADHGQVLERQAEKKGAFLFLPKPLDLDILDQLLVDPVKEEG